MSARLYELEISLDREGERFPAATIEAYTYDHTTHRLMQTEVRLDVAASHGRLRASASANLTPAQARQLAQQLMLLADHCEQRAAEIQAADEHATDEWLDREREHDLMREAEERGEEYVPAAIGAEHLAAIDAKVAAGVPLKEWEQRLVDPPASVAIVLSEHAPLQGGGHLVEEPGTGAFTSGSARIGEELQVGQQPLGVDLPADCDDQVAQGIGEGLQHLHVAELGRRHWPVSVSSGAVDRGVDGTDGSAA